MRPSTFHPTHLIATLALFLSSTTPVSAATCTGFNLQISNTSYSYKNHFLTIMDAGGAFWVSNATSTSQSDASCFHLNGTQLRTVPPLNDGSPPNTTLIASFLPTMPNPPALFFQATYEDDPPLTCKKVSGQIKCSINNESETGYVGKISEFQFCKQDGAVVQFGNQTFAGCHKTTLNVVKPAA